MCAMRVSTEASNGFGVRELPRLLTTTLVPRDFTPLPQLSLKPWEIPTERHDRRDPDWKYPTGLVRSERADGRRPRANDGEKASCGYERAVVVHLIRSVHPSWRGCAGARWAIPASCVTRISVMFCSACKRSSKSRGAAGVLAVKVARRLIGEEDGRLVGEAARNRHPPASRHRKAGKGK